MPASSAASAFPASNTSHTCCALPAPPDATTGHRSEGKLGAESARGALPNWTSGDHATWPTQDARCYQGSWNTDQMLRSGALQRLAQALCAEQSIDRIGAE